MKTHRKHATVIPDSELLPSQRALFDLDLTAASDRPWASLNEGAINRIGEIMAYDMTLTAAETHAASIKNGENVGDNSQLLRDMAFIADRLIRYTNAGAEFRPRDGYSVDYMQVNVAEQSGYSQDALHRDIASAAYEGPGIFTPENLVLSHTGTPRQRLVQFTLKNVSRFAENDYFNFSNTDYVRLYTDNFSAQPPMWEYATRTNMSDMTVYRSHKPYMMHMAPHRFVTDELGLSVITAFGNAVKVSRDTSIQ